VEGRSQTQQAEFDDVSDFAQGARTGRVCTRLRATHGHEGRGLGRFRSPAEYVRRELAGWLDGTCCPLSRLVGRLSNFP
jgi:hypothetical protein